jgi:MoxR-like ATPase
VETIEIEGKTVHLSFPDEQKIPWIGDKSYIAQIQSAWEHESESEKKIQSVFNPIIIGRCGMGKTTLAYSAAKLFHPNSSSEVFILHCSDHLTPDKALIYKIDTEKGVEYHASPLITAILKGGICIVDECQFLPSESWAVIASLLDQRYIFSDVAGLKIHAHNSFRICFTENHVDSPNKRINIPKYISILLKPQININHPNRTHELEVFKYFFPDRNPKLLHHMVDFLQSAHFEERTYSVRDCINIIQRYETTKSLQKDREIDWNLMYQAMRQILDNQAIYFLNELLNQSKDTDSIFSNDDDDFSESEEDDPNSEMNNFYEDDENYAEFIEDEEFEDSLFFLDETEGEENFLPTTDDSTVSDAEYVKNLKKKIKGNLKKRKEKTNKRHHS